MIQYKVNGREVSKAEFDALPSKPFGAPRVTVSRDICIESSSLPKNWKGATEWNPKNGKPRIVGRRALDNARAKASYMGDRLSFVDGDSE